MLTEDEISKRNKKIAIARWNKTFERDKEIIKTGNQKYTKLKARILGYLMGDGSVSIRKDNRGVFRYTCSFFSR